MRLVTAVTDGSAGPLPTPPRPGVGVTRGYAASTASGTHISSDASTATAPLMRHRPGCEGGECKARERGPCHCQKPLRATNTQVRVDMRGKLQFGHVHPSTPVLSPIAAGCQCGTAVAAHNGPQERALLRGKRKPVNEAHRSVIRPKPSIEIPANNTPRQRNTLQFYTIPWYAPSHQKHYNTNLAVSISIGPRSQPHNNQTAPPLPLRAHEVLVLHRVQRDLPALHVALPQSTTSPGTFAALWSLPPAWR